METIVNDFSQNSDHKAITITLVGCGNMGSAMLKAWLDHYGDDDIHFNIINRTALDEKYPDEEWVKDKRITFSQSIDAFKNNELQETDILINAVKPDQLIPLSGELNAAVPQSATIMGILAGGSTQAYKAMFPGYQGYAQAMPNRPATVHEGMTGLYTDSIPLERLEKIAVLLKQIGEFVEFNDPRDMDIVTAVSGSGPGYVFQWFEETAQQLAQEQDIPIKQAEQAVRSYLIEKSKTLGDPDVYTDDSLLDNAFYALRSGMIKGGTSIIHDGEDTPALDDETITRLVDQTIKGSIEMLNQDRKSTAAQMRDSVTSPNGTTEAALNKMAGRRITDFGVLIEGIQAAYERGRDISISQLKELGLEPEILEMVLES